MSNLDDCKITKKYEPQNSSTNTIPKPKQTDSSTTLLKKVKEIQDTTAFLRFSLQFEREQLERVRHSSLHTPDLPNMIVSMSPNYVMCPECSGGPVSPSSPYFFSPAPDWRQLCPHQHRHQQMAPLLPYGYSITLPGGPQGYVKSTPPNNYVSELNNVDKLCRKELFNMQKNIRNLRRMSNSWDFGGENSSSSSDSGNYERRRRRRRRIRRRKVCKKVKNEDDEY